MESSSVKLTLQGYTQSNLLRPASGTITITGKDAGKRQLWVWRQVAKPKQSNALGNWSPCTGSSSNSSVECFYTPTPQGINTNLAGLTTSVVLQFQFD